MLNAQEIRVGTLLHRDVEYEHFAGEGQRRLIKAQTLSLPAEQGRNNCRLFRTAAGTLDAGLPRTFYIARPQNSQFDLNPEGVITFVYGWDRKSQLSEDPSKPIGELWTHVLVNRADSNTVFGTFLALSSLTEYLTFRLHVYRQMRSGDIEAAAQHVHDWTERKKAIFSAAGGWEELKQASREDRAKQERLVR